MAKLIKCTRCGYCCKDSELVPVYERGETYGDQYEGDLLVWRECPRCRFTEDYFEEIEDEEFEDY